MRRLGLFWLPLLVAAPAVVAAPPATTTGTLIPGGVAAQPAKWIGSLPEGPLVAQQAASSLSQGRQMASCLVARNRLRATAFVQARGQGELAATTRPLIPLMRSCMLKGQDASFSLQMSHRLLVSLLSEALLRTGGGPTFQPVAFNPGGPQEQWIEAGQSAPIDQMATCVAYNAPQAAADVVLSEPSSPAEQTAIQRVMPSVAPCLASNATLNIDRVGLRLALASALYQRTLEPVAPAAVATASPGKN